MWKGGKHASGKVGSPTICLPVLAHMVPDKAMSHEVLLGRDSWNDFSIRKYIDVSETEKPLLLLKKKVDHLRKVIITQNG